MKFNTKVLKTRFFSLIKLLGHIKHLNACELKIYYPIYSFVRLFQFLFLLAFDGVWSVWICWKGKWRWHKAYTHSITKFTTWLLKKPVCWTTSAMYFPVNYPPCAVQTGRHTGNIKRVQEMKSSGLDVNLISGTVQLHTGFQNRKRIQMRVWFGVVNFSTGSYIIFASADWGGIVGSSSSARARNVT